MASYSSWVLPWLNVRSPNTWSGDPSFCPVPELDDLPAQPPRSNGFGGFSNGTHLSFQVLYVLVVLSHARRKVLHFNVTAARRPAGRLSNSGKPLRSPHRPTTSYGTGIAFLVWTSRTLPRPWDRRKCAFSSFPLAVALCGTLHRIAPP